MASNTNIGASQQGEDNDIGASQTAAAEAPTTAVKDPVMPSGVVPFAR